MSLAEHRSSEQMEIAKFLSGFTIETTPGAAAKIKDYREHLRPGASVYVTFLPGSDFADTTSLCVRLRSEGFEPIPHIAARSTPSAAFLDESLARLRAEAGVDQVLIIGGAVDKPVGEFSNSMQILDSGLMDKHGIRRIGIAGHPEGSPDIDDADVASALAWKNAFSERTDADMYIVTQFCFEAEPIIEWDRRIQHEGNRLPIFIGIPGLASLKSLLGHAKACGVGPSMRFLTRQARNVTKLMKLSAPDELLRQLAHYAATDESCGIVGAHMYPLGGLRRSAAWSYAVCDGDFEINPKGTGFKVNASID